MSAIPTTVEEYMASAPAEARVMLEELRDVIRMAAPGCTEQISYQVPTFLLDKPVVAISAAKKHCGFHVMSPELMRSFANEVEGYETTVSTIRLPLGEPVPRALVTRLVKARIAENESRNSERRAPLVDSRASPRAGRDVYAPTKAYTKKAAGRG